MNEEILERQNDVGGVNRHRIGRRFQFFFRTAKSAQYEVIFWWKISVLVNKITKSLFGFTQEADHRITRPEYFKHSIQN